MLRICYSDTGGAALESMRTTAGPWVDELALDAGAMAREAAPRSQAVVDLSDVTFIDESGERLLAEMRCAGVEFVAAGVETKVYAGEP